MVKRYAAALVMGVLLQHGPVAIAQAPVPRTHRATPVVQSLAKPGEETLTRYIRLRNRMRNMKVDSHREAGGLVLEGLSGNLGGGTMSVRGRVSWSGANSNQHIRLELTNVQSSAFLDAVDIGLDGRISGVISGWADLRWQGTKMMSMKQSLQGNAQLQIGAGSVSNAKVLDYIAEISGIEEMRTIEFSQGRMVAKAGNSTLYLDEFLLEGPLLRARLTGTMDLTTDQIRLHPEIWIAPELAQRSSRVEVRSAVQLLDTMSADRKSRLVEIPLPIVFTGTLRKPTVGWNNAMEAEAR